MANSAVTPTAFYSPFGGTDSDLTIKGLKVYLNGSTYNNAVTITTTCNIGSYSATRISFIPYQMSDGSWRLKFNGRVTYASTSGEVNITIPGVTFKSTSNYNQTFTVNFIDGGQANVKYAYISPNTGFIAFRSVVAEPEAIFCGDVELDSKPTWAY